MIERLFRSMHRIRRVEEEIIRVYPTDKIMSPVHLSIGQEAVSVGVCDALQPIDVVFGTYRCHALYLAKGGDLKLMIAELYGKSTGCAKGKAGSMHLIDAAAGVMGASAVVATSMPVAVGYAMANRMQQRERVVACFLGDGAAEEGVFHESLNFAALKNLPVLFVCENNGYAIHSRRQNRQAVGEIADYARAVKMPCETIADMDVQTIRQRTAEITGAMRTGLGGPCFLEVHCYRWMEHVGPNEDYQSGYRDRREAEHWVKNDQLRLLGDRLSPAVRSRIEMEVEAEIRAAFDFAEASPFPDASELYTDMVEEQ